MFYLKLFSMFNEDDYEKEYLKKNKILKYFYKPKLKQRSCLNELANEKGICCRKYC